MNAQQYSTATRNLGFATSFLVLATLVADFAGAQREETVSALTRIYHVLHASSILGALACLLTGVMTGLKERQERSVNEKA
jgi:putative copper export protein